LCREPGEERTASFAAASIFPGDRMTSQSPFSHSIWHRPACNNGSCVEVAFEHGKVGVRDGKGGTDGPILTFTAAEWTAFVQATRRGRFDIAWFRRIARKTRMFGR
jgi:hypothetical protein